MAPPSAEASRDVNFCLCFSVHCTPIHGLWSIVISWRSDCLRANCLNSGIEQAQNTEKNYCSASPSMCKFEEPSMRSLTPFSCRTFGTHRIVRATGLTVALLAVLLPGSLSASERPAVATTSDRLVEQAGQAKVVGNRALAYALLREARVVAPDNSLIRWQLGQMKVGGQWMSIEEAERRLAADPRQTKYEQRRDVLSATPQGQVELARWCRANKLEDEAKLHWASVLTTDPNNKPAARALNMKWHGGQLQTTDEIKEANKTSRQKAKSTHEWASRVAEWMRLLADKNESPPGTVINDIRGVDDVGAIGPVEKATLNSRLRFDEKNPAAKRLSLAFLGALAEMRCEEGTKSVLRHAVMSPFEEVRAAAIAELRYRPLNDFVPTLVEAMAAPIQSTYQVVNDFDGSVHYLHSFYREGPFADWSYRRERSILPAGAGMRTANSLPDTSSANVIQVGGSSRSGMVSIAAARQSARNYEQEIVSDEQKVAKENEITTDRNERIVAVLTGTTDQSLGSEPRAWWTWWQDYTDYYHNGERPVYSGVDSSYAYVRPPVLSSVPVECFVRGTPVWAKTGQRPIETLRSGDFVL